MAAPNTTTEAISQKLQAEKRVPWVGREGRQYEGSVVSLLTDLIFWQGGGPITMQACLNQPGD